MKYLGASIFLLLSFTAFAQMRTTGLGFAAPTINDRNNVFEPQKGEIVFDTNSSDVPGFYGNAGTTSSPSWVQLSAPFSPDFQSENSSAKTPPSSGIWLQMTDNSITLSGGKWRVSGTCGFDLSGGGPGYTDTRCGWKDANGADTSTEPSSATVQAGRVDSWVDLDGGGVQRLTMVMPTIRVDASTPVTIYLVPYAAAVTPSYARVTTSIYAEKVSN